MLLNCYPEEMNRKLGVWGWHAKENRKVEEERTGQQYGEKPGPPTLFGEETGAKI